MGTIKISDSVNRYSPDARENLAARKLNARQQMVYDYMQEFFRENDCLPPSRVIAKHFGWKSARSPYLILEELVRLQRLEGNALGKLRFSRTHRSEHDASTDV